ncbi:hypothetical protein predicted by Glimmer/Critica [Bdellovibrio bacteriovorus HD100]|uniref:Uncharacterized protein n=1 Tax=Bdellovibrio bacteriovorus (strain ATCC 15356 / DSM 50701 / NCIMB 9529 / HD100) TaxID=264462 RepID=Q6MQV4_BDEBA|nr:hypothetical protein predicted by Glimmer/Critica [Bdellovibrio bacteriovorus HD100]
MPTSGATTASFVLRKDTTMRKIVFSGLLIATLFRCSGVYC